jgi:spore coat polysaccharide biosynthesis predicted glycosyltransferase SpsG
MLQNLKEIKYDLIIIDGPCAERNGFYEFLDLFNLSSVSFIFFDDMMSLDHLKVANLTAKKLNKYLNIIKCAPNKKAVQWFNGKIFSYIEI